MREWKIHQHGDFVCKRNIIHYSVWDFSRVRNVCFFFVLSASLSRSLSPLFVATMFGKACSNFHCSAELLLPLRCDLRRAELIFHSNERKVCASASVYECKCERLYGVILMNIAVWCDAKDKWSKTAGNKREILIFSSFPFHSVFRCYFSEARAHTDTHTFACTPKAITNFAFTFPCILHSNFVFDIKYA